jgi:hypothetical protein
MHSLIRYLLAATLGSALVPAIAQEPLPADEPAAELLAATASHSPPVTEEEARQYIKVGGGKELKGLSRVVIPYFQVEFVTRNQAQAVSSNTAAHVSSNLSFSMLGADDVQFQALTERIYQDTVSALQAAGIEVVPLDTLKAQAAYAELVTSWARPAPFLLESGGAVRHFFAPQGMDLYFDPGDKRFSLSSNFGSMFTTKRHAVQLEGELFKATGIPVMRVRYVVEFTSRTESRSSVFSRTAEAKTGGKAVLSLVPEGTRMMINTTGAQQPDVERDVRPLLLLKAPLQSSDTAWLKDLREVNAGMNTAKSAGVAVLSTAAALSGFGKATAVSIKDYEIEVDAAAYAEAVTALTDRATQMFLLQVQALR